MIRYHRSWRTDGSSSTTSVVDDVGEKTATVSTSPDPSVYGALVDVLKKTLKQSSETSSTKGEATKTSIENSTNTNIVNPDTSSSANKWPEAIEEDKIRELAALLESLVGSQNEVNTISQIISTSEKYYKVGDENYKNATKTISEKESELNTALDAWKSAKDDMTDLQKVLRNKLDSAALELLTATTEAERAAAQAKLDAAKSEWDALCKQMLEYAAEEISNAKKLGDKNLEKQWQDSYDRLYGDDEKIKSSLESLSDNMQKYLLTQDEDFNSMAKLAFGNYSDASTDAYDTLEKMKKLESASVAYVQYLLDKAKELLELSKSDLATSLEQAKKAYDLALAASETANRLYEQAKGTPYEEQAKLVAENAKKLADDAHQNYDRIQQELYKKNLLGQVTDDEFINKRLKEAEDYVVSLGYKYPVTWSVNRGDKVIDSFTKLKNLGLKDDTYYKVVGKISGGGLFLGNDIRYYKVAKKDVFCSSFASDISQGTFQATIGDPFGTFGGRRCHVSADVYADLTYYIVEVDGDVFVQGITYANEHLGNFRAQEYENRHWGGLPGAPVTDQTMRDQYPDSSFFNLLKNQYSGNIGSQSATGTYSETISAKIFSKSFQGY